MVSHVATFVIPLLRHLVQARRRRFSGPAIVGEHGAGHNGGVATSAPAGSPGGERPHGDGGGIGDAARVPLVGRRLVAAGAVIPLKAPAVSFLAAVRRLHAAAVGPVSVSLAWSLPGWLKATPVSCSLRRAPGGVPEWLKGADCKSVGAAYPGSNPGSPTSIARLAQSAEHLHGKEGVRGSSPRPGSIFFFGPSGRLSRSAAAALPPACRARGACRTPCAGPHGRGARR